MKMISITQMEKYSGIKAHTIRMWEQRFNVFSPERTDGNFRKYNIEDLKLLLNLSVLTRYGYSISKLVKMTPDDMSERVAALSQTAAQSEICMNRLLIKMLVYDISRFENLLDEFVARNGIDATITEVIVPFLERTNMLSYADQGPATHFTVTAIRKKIIHGIENIRRNPPQAPSVLMFLSYGQHYDLILLYLTYCLKRQGLDVLYLGTNISLESLRELTRHHLPDMLVTYIAPGEKTDPDKLAGFIRQHFPHARFHIASSSSQLNKMRAVYKTELSHYGEVSDSVLKHLRVAR